MKEEQALCGLEQAVFVLEHSISKSDLDHAAGFSAVFHPINSNVYPGLLGKITYPCCQIYIQKPAFLLS